MSCYNDYFPNSKGRKMTNGEMIIQRTNEITESLGIVDLDGLTYSHKLMELARRFRLIKNDKGVEMCELLSAFAAKYKV